MRREPEFFGETELELIIMARRLKHALAIEKILNERGVDYYLETGNYLSGLLFRTTKVGVYFYTTPQDANGARAVLEEGGYKFKPDGKLLP
jgi:hypothetical protein